MIRQMVICTNDHTDGDLHTLIFKFSIWEHLELELKSKLKLELKLSNRYAYGKLYKPITLHSSLPFRTDNRLEDRRP